MLGAKPAVILTQIGLALISGYGVYRTGLLLRLPTTLSTLACGIYLLLPHTLIYPHQLSSEALHSPLLIISLWMTAEHLAKPTNTKLNGHAILGALLAGAAVLIRPITLLWPFFAGFVVSRHARMRTGLYFIILAFTPVLLWMGFIVAQTGKFGLGESSHDMGHNLYQRVMRISATLPLVQDEIVREQYLTQGEDGSLGITEYLRFGMEYPVPFIEHAIRDLAVFVGKSGIERVFIDYFELHKESRNQRQDAEGGWRAAVGQIWSAVTIGYLCPFQGAVLVVSLVGSVVLLIMIILAVVGGWTLANSIYADHSRYIGWLFIDSTTLHPYFFSGG